MGAGIGGVIGNVFSGIMQSQLQLASSQSAASSLQATAAFQDAQARLFDFQAQDALQRAAADKRKSDRAAKARLGKTAIKFLKGGISLSGSPLAILGQEAGEFELEGQEILTEGQRTAITARNQSALRRFQAAQTRNRAQSALDIGELRAGTTLLGTAIKAFR